MAVILRSIFLIFSLSTFYSCKQSGCTDTRAYNFCYDCKKENGSCIYYGTVKFWWSKNTNDSLMKYNIYGIELITENMAMGMASIGPHAYQPSAPGCEGNAPLSAYKELHKGNPVNVTYKVLNNSTKQTIWSGTINYTSGNCQIIELVWKP